MAVKGQTYPGFDIPSKIKTKTKIRHEHYTQLSPSNMATDLKIEDLSKDRFALELEFGKSLISF